MNERRPRIFGPLLIITLGIVLLLNNLNLLPWDVWQTIWQLWPVVLIFWGLSALFGGASSTVQVLVGALWSILVIFLIVTVIAWSSPEANTYLHQLPYWSQWDSYSESHWSN